MTDAISKLVELTHAEGLHGELTQWSEADVWWFAGPMPQRYFETDGSPHNRADVGLKDDSKGIAISFARNN